MINHFKIALAKSEIKRAANKMTVTDPTENKEYQANSQYGTPNPSNSQREFFFGSEPDLALTTLTGFDHESFCYLRYISLLALLSTYPVRPKRSRTKFSRRRRVSEGYMLDFHFLGMTLSWQMKEGLFTNFLLFWNHTQCLHYIPQIF